MMLRAVEYTVLQNTLVHYAKLVQYRYRYTPHEPVLSPGHIV